MGLHTTTHFPEEAPLTDAEWKMVKPLIPQRPPAGGRYNDHRRVLGGILSAKRTSSAVRTMPPNNLPWTRPGAA